MSTYTFNSKKSSYSSCMKMIQFWVFCRNNCWEFEWYKRTMCHGEMECLHLSLAITLGTKIINMFFWVEFERKNVHMVSKLSTNLQVLIFTIVNKILYEILIYCMNDKCLEDFKQTKWQRNHVWLLK